MTEFTIDHLAVGMGNTDRHNRPAFVDAYVAMGPMRFRAHLNAQGELTIDEALRDEALKVEIAVALRKAALEQLTNNWARVNAADRKRLAEQTNSDHAVR